MAARCKRTRIIQILPVDSGLFAAQRPQCRGHLPKTQLVYTVTAAHREANRAPYHTGQRRVSFRTQARHTSGADSEAHPARYRG